MSAFFDMTESQKFRFYFPAWSRCVRANGWHMVKGRLQLDAARLNEEGGKVLALATQRAAVATAPVSMKSIYCADTRNAVTKLKILHRKMRVQGAMVKPGIEYRRTNQADGKIQPQSNAR